MAKQTKEALSFKNINDGLLDAEFEAKLREAQDAVIVAGGKAVLTIKVVVSREGDQFMGVSHEVGLTAPKVKKASLYARGEHYLVADPVVPVKGEQTEMAEVNNVVELNRKAQ